MAGFEPAHRDVVPIGGVRRHRRMGWRCYATLFPVALISLVVAVVGTTACNQSTAVAPTSLPTIQGRTTALANLNAIEGWEHAVRPHSNLMEIDAVVNRAGIPVSESGWTYTYRDPADEADGYFTWHIGPTGSLTPEHFVDPTYTQRGLRPMTLSEIVIDSDNAVDSFFRVLEGSPTAHSVPQPTFEVHYVRGGTLQYISVRLVLPNCRAGVGISIGTRTGTLFSSSGTCDLPRPG